MSMQMEVSQAVKRSREVKNDAQRSQEYEQARQIVLAEPNYVGSGLLKRTIMFFSSLSVGVLLWRALLPSESTIYNPTDYAARTENILKTTPLIDGHNDLPFLLRMQLDNKIYGNRFPFREGEIAERISFWLNTDL